MGEGDDGGGDGVWPAIGRGGKGEGGVGRSRAGQGRADRERRERLWKSLVLDGGV